MENSHSVLNSQRDLSFFFFFFFLRSPAISLGFTHFLGEIFAYVTVF